MDQQDQYDVAVIGGGPAGLMAAEVLAGSGAAVTIYERMPSLARKFLLAGRGGLNLTHSEELAHLLQRYAPPEPRLLDAIKAFPPDALRKWCEDLSQTTFVGSSGRVFPTAMKASPLLRAWLKRLGAMGVKVKTRHQWTGWNEEGWLRFESPEGPVVVAPDATVLALGGASWPRLGSDGGWVDIVGSIGVRVAPLEPSNCGFLVPWTDVFRSRFEGEPIKRIGLSVGGASVVGEAVVTKTGLEGGAIYAVSAPLRGALAPTGETTLVVDLRPGMTLEELKERLERPRAKQSLSTFLRKSVHLPPVAINLLQEAAVMSGAPLNTLSPAALAERIKAVPVRISGIAPMDKAISTAGGIAWGDIDEHFMLRRRAGTFVAGEMLDWDAPTGGFLLQASFATGAAAARGALQWRAAMQAA